MFKSHQISNERPKIGTQGLCTFILMTNRIHRNILRLVSTLYSCAAAMSEILPYANLRILIVTNITEIFLTNLYTLLLPFFIERVMP